MQETKMDTHFKTKSAMDVDIEPLVSELKSKIEGEVRFDDGSRALYATDGSNYRQVPIGVVIPRTDQDIIETTAICKKYQAPLLSRGGGTSLAGQCCNVAVVMDMSKYYNNVLHVDKDKKLVRTQAGIVLDHLLDVTQKEGLIFAPDPATHNYCTIGGMLGNDSCGIHSVMSQHEGYGARTSDNTESLTVLTYDGVKMEVGPTSEEELEKIVSEGGRKGEIYKKLKALRDKYADLIRERYPKIPRRVSGYSLDELLPEKGFNVARALAGSEGTCATILEATLKLLPMPGASSLLVLGYPDVYHAGRHMPQVMKHKPIGLEGIDKDLIGFMRKKELHIENLSLLPEGGGWLVAEFGGKTDEEASQKAREVMEELKKDNNPPSMHLFDKPEREEKIWEIRESGLGATAFIPDMEDTWPGWEDTAVPPDRIGDYLEDLRELFNKYDYKAALYGHFGQGLVHCRINFDLVTKEGVEKHKRFTEEAADLVVSYGGSLSGEHGDGQARADLLEKMYGKELVQAFREFKAIWDPDGKMNPGKVIDPYGQLANLRLGPDYEPALPETHFKFPDDEGSFARAALRCVGVGKCRRVGGGTMCPSYMVTHEEKHTTRGRAHMLFEMLQGDVVSHGWKDENVKDSLDLCLSCKGCKGDCPVNVDIATYKAEFLSHYYEGRLRPRTAYAFGWIYWWARLASLMPKVANFFTQAPVLSDIAKAVAGIAPERKLPEFAAQTFKQWFRQRGSKDTDKPKVILWADTFNNHFLPETLVAGVEVLEAAGFQVIVPHKSLCCGRPLYEYGWLDTAKRLLLEILDTLREDIQQGTPVVGLEPSCVATFRDELGNLFPHDENAMRLQKQTYTLAEFLEKKAEHFDVPQLKRKGVMHGHCHHKAIMEMNNENQLLQKMGVDFQLLDSGCCGMAGSFGFEKGERYDVSVKAGERALLPAVREAAKDTLIITDGFSCREQIEQETDRKALHTAQVLQMALREGNNGSAGNYPEKQYVERMKLHKPKEKTVKLPVILGMAGAVGTFFLTRLLKK